MPADSLNRATAWLERALNYRFRNEQLLLQALTHRSARGTHNERLEFLGDSVLGLVVSDVVYAHHPSATEGDLSRLRSSLVKDDSLAMVADSLGLGEHLVLGSGERKSGGHRRNSILADALEALFAAVYLDGGIDAARDVIGRAFGKRMEVFPDVSELRDPKTRLQEWLQGRQLDLPRYSLVNEFGADHRKQFEVSCVVAIATDATFGTASTRRKAEQKAARLMLASLTSGDDE